MSLLISSGVVNIDTANSHPYFIDLSLVGTAVRNRNIEATRLLLDAGATFDNHLLTCQDPLAIAVELKELDIMKLMLQEGADTSALVYGSSEYGFIDVWQFAAIFENKTFYQGACGMWAEA